MTRHPDFLLHPVLRAEIEQQTFDLRELEPRQVVCLDLAEGSDHERHLGLEISLVETPPDGQCPEFEVLDSSVLEGTIEANRKIGMPHPDFIGEKFIVRGGCSWAPGCRPTMISLHSIDTNRYVWVTFIWENTDQPETGMDYFAYVRGVKIKS